MALIYKTLFFLIIFLCSSQVFAQLDQNTAKSILESKVRENKILNSDDFQEIVITDQYVSRGIEHVYFQQAIEGIEIWETFVSIHGKRTDYILTNNQSVNGIKSMSLDNRRVMPILEVIDKLAVQKGYSKANEADHLFFALDAKNKSGHCTISSISNNLINFRLVYYQTQKDRLTLHWLVEIDDKNSSDYINFLVNAATGEIIKEYNYTVSCRVEDLHHVDHKGKKCDHEETHATNKSSAVTDGYLVYNYPVEAPHNGDRTEIVAPWLNNTTASPDGWHTIGATDYVATRGNNVDAYEDQNETNAPTNGNTARAVRSSNLDYVFPLDTSLSNPFGNKDASITNLFYWSNLVHDVWYNYGFDEPSGNFQEDNFGRGGASGDYVNAEGFDGSGTCNANFSTPTDGGNPRMQMYICGDRDGSLDNGVVVHEYGHGISTRLTGGPGNSSCLNNQEQMGEGWSDFFGMVMTIEPGDEGTDSRGMGTWLVEQGPNGDGIRTHPYSTDFGINPFTYDDIIVEVAPHGVGSVWATMLWEMTWDLIDAYGFDPDIYNGTGGNNMAMALVIEGLKIQPCSPGFVDGRDAILAADDILYGGANKCLIWNSFAKRGLGFSALQGTTGSKSDGTEAFDLPTSCTIEFTKSVDLTEAQPGNTLTYTITTNNTMPQALTNVMISDVLPDNTLFVSASDGGTYNSTTNVITWPSIDIAVNELVVRTLVVQIDPTAEPLIDDFIDDVETGSGNWTTSTTGASSWNISTTRSASPSSSWFANGIGSNSIADLDLVSPIGLSSNSILSFDHYYITEETWDGGLVYISTDNGNSWQNLGDYFTSNGYNSRINNNVNMPAFSGNSGGFIASTVDLSSFAGQNAIFRFEKNCDASVFEEGWYVDNVMVDNLSLYIENTALLEFDGNSLESNSPYTLVEVNSNNVIVSASSTPTNCANSYDGTATATAQNGNGGYTYQWSNGATTKTITGLAPGSYTVTATDGVTYASSSVFVADNILLIDVTSTEDFDNGNGTATATASKGVPNYNYLWSNGESTSMISGLDAGTYTVTVTDDNNCETVGTVEVESCYAFDLNVQLDQYPFDITIVILDENNNEIYNQDFTGFPNGSLITESFCVPAGCYTLDIDDSFGDGLCSNNANPPGYVEIVDPVNSDIVFSACDFGSGTTFDFCLPFVMEAELTVVQPSCSGIDDGSISVELIGGTGNYTYQYTPGGTSSSISNLGPGTYNVVASDGVTTIDEDIVLYTSVASVYVDQNEGEGTLRYAIENGCPTDTIRFEPVLLNNTINVIDQPIIISRDIVILGLGVDDLTISGNQQTRIFDIQTGNSLHMYDFKFIDTYAPDNGGAFYNLGEVLLESIRLESNFEATTPKAWSGDGQVIIRKNVEIKE